MPRLVNCAGRPRRAGAALVLAPLAAVLFFAPPTPRSQAETPWTNGPVRIERGPGGDERPRIATDPGVAVTFRRPLLLAEDGLLPTDSRPVRLDRVRLPPRDQLCGTAEGGRWSCGRRAATRLNALLAGRAALCGRAADADAAVIAGDCRVGGRSVAETLVEEGWAEPTAAADDAALQRLFARARQDRRGLWGDGIR